MGSNEAAEGPERAERKTRGLHRREPRGTVLDHIQTGSKTRQASGPSITKWSRPA